MLSSNPFCDEQTYHYAWSWNDLEVLQHEIGLGLLVLGQLIYVGGLLVNLRQVGSPGSEYWIVTGLDLFPA